MKKLKLNKQNIFLLINTLIIIIISIFYAWRLIYFYKIDNPNVKNKETLYKILTLKKNVVTKGSGLYQNNNKYYYKGKIDNNYIYYSGRLFRIVSINKNTLKMITEENQTSLVWGVKNTYLDSYAKNYLESFLKTLSNTETYLSKTNWIIDSKENPNKTNNYLGLLTKEEYEKSFDKETYLNNNSYWWLSDTTTKGAMYVNNVGKVSDDKASGNTYYNFGIRPVINIKHNMIILKGEGTKDNPYIFENKQNNRLDSKSIGEYITYNNSNWRIIEQNNAYIKVVLDGYIKDNNEFYITRYNTINNVYNTTSGLGYYLNNTYLKTLDTNYLVKGEIGTNRYDLTVDYDYNNINTTKIKAYVGLLNIAEYFINDYTDYFLGTRTSTYTDTIYKVTKSGKIYDDLISSNAKVRPVIFLKKDLIISKGSGYQKDPYILGEV